MSLDSWNAFIQDPKSPQSGGRIKIVDTYIFANPLTGFAFFYQRTEKTLFCFELTLIEINFRGINLITLFQI